MVFAAEQEEQLDGNRFFIVFLCWREIKKLSSDRPEFVSISKLARSAMDGTGVLCRPSEQRVTVNPPELAACCACITSFNGQRETGVDFVFFHFGSLIKN